MNLYICILLFLIFPRCNCDTRNTDDKEFEKNFKDFTFSEKIVGERCARNYADTCLWWHISKYLDRLNTSYKSYEIIRGVSVVRNATEKSFVDVSADEREWNSALSSSNSTSTKNTLKKLVLSKASKLLNSLSLRIQILDIDSTISVKRFARDLIDEFALDQHTGRDHRKKTDNKKKHSLWTLGSMALAGTIFVAAMAGKAVVLSSLALLVALLHSRHKGGGGGHHGGNVAGSSETSAAYKTTLRCSELPVDVREDTMNAEESATRIIVSGKKIDYAEPYGAGGGTTIQYFRGES